MYKTGYSEEIVEMITNSEEFDFSMDDIGRIRKEMKLFVKRMAEKYKEMAHSSNKR